MSFPDLRMKAVFVVVDTGIGTKTLQRTVHKAPVDWNITKNPLIQVGVRLSRVTLQEEKVGQTRWKLPLYTKRACDREKCIYKVCEVLCVFKYSKHCVKIQCKTNMHALDSCWCCALMKLTSSRKTAVANTARLCLNKADSKRTKQSSPSSVFFFRKHRKISLGARSHLDPWRQREPSVPPSAGEWAAGAHHWRGEERDPHQPVHQKRSVSLPDQPREEDPQGCGGGVPGLVQRGEELWIVKERETSREGLCFTYQRTRNI